MTNPLHHPKCPQCKGEGFYLSREGQGYMRDGSFSHNKWEDCSCRYYMTEEQLPKIKVKPATYAIVHHPSDPKRWYWLIIQHDQRGPFGRPQRITTLGLDGVE